MEVMAITARHDVDHASRVWLSRLLSRKGDITETSTQRSELVMSTLLNKSAAVVNAIAITTALAVISGYLPIQPLSLSLLQTSFQAQFLNSHK